MKNGKGQGGAELITSYGWIVLVGAGFILLLSQTNVLRHASCEKVRYSFSHVVPVDWAVYRGSNAVVVTAENWAGYPIEVTSVSVTLQDLVCAGQFSGATEPGARGLYVVNCPTRPGIPDKYLTGDCYKAELYFSYVNKFSGNSYESRGRISGTIEEVAASAKPTGTATLGRCESFPVTAGLYIYLFAKLVVPE